MDGNDVAELIIDSDAVAPPPNDGGENRPVDPAGFADNVSNDPSQSECRADLFESPLSNLRQIPLPKESIESISDAFPPLADKRESVHSPEPRQISRKPESCSSLRSDQPSLGSAESSAGVFNKGFLKRYSESISSGSSAKSSAGVLNTGFLNISDGDDSVFE